MLLLNHIKNYFLVMPHCVIIFYCGGASYGVWFPT